MGDGFSGTRRGILFALTAAALFGLSTPVTKVLLGRMSPVLVAGLLYLGSGIGLTVVRLLSPAKTRGPRLERADLPWMGGAVLMGGVVAPVLLMWGLRATPASTASLLLNLEGAFTAVLAWIVFRENYDLRIALGMLLILAGGVVLSWPGRGEEASLPTGAILIVAACFGWAVDNNLTQRVSRADPIAIAAIKGAVAGSVNIVVALAAGARVPSPGLAAATMVVGLLGYGISLSLFILALRHVGTARTGAYFSVAPFIGAAASVFVLHEPTGIPLAIAAALMAVGVWLHLSEHHIHEHAHERLVHSHRHVHDEHHRHGHGPDCPPDEPHTHEHVHEPVVHAHPHYPDIHHRHHHG